MTLAIAQYPYFTQTLVDMPAIALETLGAALGIRARPDMLTSIVSVIEEDHRMAAEMNKPAGEVQYGTGWNCCAKSPAKAIVFDEGTKWAVCLPCSRQYRGTVEDLPRY
jgi:hypothetical protein